MTLNNLKVICKLNGLNVREMNKKGKDDLIKVIVEKFIVENGLDQTNESCIEMFQLKMLYDVIMPLYLKPMPNQESESKCTKLGYVNETKLIVNLFEDADCRKEILSIKTCETCDIGLVMNRISNYLKTTIDFLAIIKLTSAVMKILGIECKTRGNANVEFIARQIAQRFCSKHFSIK